MTMSKALIAMSGGVDSSVAALIMKEKGYECIGCTMMLHDSDEETIQEHSCCSLNDVEDARSVAYRLGMKYYVFNFKDEFKHQVIDRFVDCYLHGATPNPCIDCNEFMKFNKLFERADQLGCDKVVTGHYARIEEREDGFHLLEGPDPLKDQSYVLYRFKQDQLARTCLPLGDMTKEETRRLATENDFINAAKKDSQDICFVLNGDYASVVEEVARERGLATGTEPGDFVDVDGKVLGRHKGIIHYTIGQRRGLGIAAPASLYVLRIDTANNRVILGSNEDLFTSHLEAGEATWISGRAPGEGQEVEVRVRYHGRKTRGIYRGLDETHFSIDFEEPVRAITPGQAAVVYLGEEVLGGGIISF